MMWYIYSNSNDFVKSLNAGQSDVLYFPIKVQMFSGSPITDIWKKKKGLKNTDKIVAATQGWISKNNKEIYVNMISVRSKWRNNNIATIMMNYLKSKYPGYKITISKTTPNGTAFFKKYDTDSSFKYDTVDHNPI